MTQEEYLQIYISQQRTLHANSLENSDFSEYENHILDLADNFANGEFLDFKKYDIKDIGKLSDALISMLYKVKNEKQLKQLLQLLDALNLIAEEEPSDENEENRKLKNKSVLKPSDDKIDENPVTQKAKDYSAWAKQQYLQFDQYVRNRKKSKLIDTTKFEGLTRDQLIAFYHPSKFYSLSTKDRNALFQATVNEYLVSNGAEPCAVNFMEMPITDRSIHYGLYRPQYGDLFINSKLFDNIDELAQNGNIHFPYQILSTLIHEATHALQFQSITKESLTEKDQLILNSMKHSQSNMSYHEYLAEADELDARNSALEYIRNAIPSVQKGRENLKAFYNTEKNKEMKNSKKYVQKNVQSMFPDLFDSTFLAPDLAKMQRMNSSAKEMQAIVKGNYVSQIMQRRKRI